jgi:hypothetical protein
MKLQILGFAASIALLAAWTHPARAVHHDERYTVDMTAALATPPAAGNGTGHATLTLSGQTLHYDITVSDLSGPATMAHIHVGQPGVGGPPVYTFKIEKVGSGKLAEGDIDLTKPASKSVSGDSLKVLLDNGSAYINVHTAANPGGEIRGQVVKED